MGKLWAFCEGSEMIYYFVVGDGDYIETEDNVRSWYEKTVNPNMFTVKREAVAEQKRRIKARIAELTEVLEGLK
jgi:hypothetical protein